MHQDTSTFNHDAPEGITPINDINDISMLKNPPLIEVIAEIRWMLRPSKPVGVLRDPHYKLLPGKMATILQDDYPFLEELPAADMPEEIAANMVQYRFRVGYNKWPLVQLGPGIITVNQLGPDYQWTDLERRIEQAINALFEAHPKATNLKMDRLILRYIDSFPFNFKKKNILDYLDNGLKTSIALDDRLLSSIGISEAPSALDVKLLYKIKKDGAALSTRFASGKVRDKDSLIIETVVQQDGDKVPSNRDSIMRWFAEAHAVTHNWFFTMIEGPILEECK